MNILFLVVLISNNSPGYIVHDDVEIIELNHLYRDDGILILDQYIFWEWDNSSKERKLIKTRTQTKYHVKLHGHRVITWKPHKDKTVREHDGIYYLLFHDNKILRKVTSKNFVETWTTVDPEVEERNRLGKHLRRGLTDRSRIISND